MAKALKLSNELIEMTKPYAAAMNRSIAEQIEHWAWIGKAAEENSEFPVQFIQDTLLAVEAANIPIDSATGATGFGSRIHQRFAALADSGLPNLDRNDLPRAAKLPE